MNHLQRREMPTARDNLRRHLGADRYDEIAAMMAEHPGGLRLVTPASGTPLSMDEAHFCLEYREVFLSKEEG
jgi:hypothetical protein